MQNYVNIGKASKIIGASIDSLRRWEKKGLLKVIRSPGGHRYYSLSDLETLTHKFVKRTKSIQPPKAKIQKKISIWIYLLIVFAILDAVLILIYIYN